MIVARGNPADAVDSRLLRAEAMRAAFARPRPWAVEDADEFRWDRDVALTPAAVLVPLVAVPAQDALAVLLTRRTAHLHDHAGQISFPGGRVDDADQSRIDTALREAREEIGLQSESVEVIGALPEYLTGTGFSVTPVVGIVHGPVELRPDPFEVAEVFETPLAFLMNPEHHETRAARWIEGRITHERHFYAMQYAAADARYFIWGATAAMLRNLYHFLRAQI